VAAAKAGLDPCSSDESLLTASDAVVHLMPAGKFRLIGECMPCAGVCACAGSGSWDPYAL
jgi:hypothetical protein